jgi:signal peptidase
MDATNNSKMDVKKILSIVANVLVWAFVVVSLLITVMVFAAQNSEDGVPSLFGVSLINIETGSMKDTYFEGDLVFMTKLTREEKLNLQPGQIITFRTSIDINNDGKAGDINTHRIYEKIEGTLSYVTIGDNNLIPDNQGNNPYTVHVDDIIGVCTEEGVLRGVGGVLKFLRSSLGFFLCIVLPLILFFLYELYRFITVLVAEKKKNDSLEEILRKLEAAEKEYAEKLQNSRLEELIQKEEARRAR